MSEIDIDLPESALKQTQSLSELILNRFSVLSRSNEIDTQLASPQSAWQSLNHYLSPGNFWSTLSNMLSYSSDSASVSAYKGEYLAVKSSAHMYDETRMIYDRMARQLGNKPCFFYS